MNNTVIQTCLYLRRLKTRRYCKVCRVVFGSVRLRSGAYGRRGYRLSAAFINASYGQLHLHTCRTTRNKCRRITSNTQANTTETVPITAACLSSVDVRKFICEPFMFSCRVVFSIRLSVRTARANTLRLCAG